MEPKTIKLNETEYVKKSEQVKISVNTGSLAAAAVGMKVLVRSINEGINCGIVEAADETGIILKNCRRLWYHKPANKALSWYEGVAIDGISEDSKVSPTVDRKFIIEDYSITECSPSAFDQIMAKVPHAQD